MIDILMLKRAIVSKVLIPDLDNPNESIYFNAGCNNGPIIKYLHDPAKLKLAINEVIGVIASLNLSQKVSVVVTGILDCPDFKVVYDPELSSVEKTSFAFFSV